jgi:yeast amino acid transporter
MTSALSACNENVYAVSRTLVAMAKQGSIPPFFLTTNKRGIPWPGIVVCFVFGLLAFLTLSTGSGQAFSWLSNLSALSSLVAWICICICFLRFKKALEVQGLCVEINLSTGIDRKKLPLRGWFQPYIAWVCIVAFTLVLIFNGFQSFIGGFDISDFFASYITLPTIALCFIGYKCFRGTKFVDPHEVLLNMGPAEALYGTHYDITH